MRGTLTLPALAVLALLAGCTGDPSMLPASPSPTQTETPAESAPTMPVGPLALTPEPYWAPPITDGDVTTVQVGGCGTETACPAFTVSTGDGVPTDPATPLLHDGVACPGGTAPSSAELTDQTPSTLAYGEATLAVFDVVCTDPGGTEQATVTQRQWHAEGPTGPIAVVDRWMLDGLPQALAEATWADGA